MAAGGREKEDTKKGIGEALRAAFEEDDTAVKGVESLLARLDKIDGTKGDSNDDRT